MSSIRTAKRELEATLGAPVRFERGAGRDTDSPVELHGPEWHPPEPAPFGKVNGGGTTWLGKGDTHDAAIVDAWETLRVRDRLYSHASTHSPEGPQCNHI